MIYHFKDIGSGQIAEGYTILDINDHKAEILPLKAIKIINNKSVIYEIEDAAAILLAEKHGGELHTSQGKPPKDAEKYRAEQVGKTAELRIAAEAAIQKQNQADLTKAVQSGELAAEDAPRLTDPVAAGQEGRRLPEFSMELKEDKGTGKKMTGIEARPGEVTTLTADEDK